MFSAQSGVALDKNWSTGVSIADVNLDGFDDIYVCKFLYDDPSRRKNLLLINDGTGKFANKASEYGLEDTGYSIMGNFFDYDLDGDLDLYVCNQPPNSINLKPALKNKIDYQYTDRLYQNQGNGTFQDVTNQAGIKNYNYSLSASMIDYNNDGWPDLYIASDYDEADFLYVNNGDGTFTNTINQSMKHIPNFSMGVDVADINNDGWLDLFTADMVAEDNFRLKTNMGGMNPDKFWALAKGGYHYQYMYNAMQLNNGNGTFSEIAQLSGISNTDWSWATLFIDFDQDGWKDLMVTNGLIKEVRNKDFEIERKAFLKKKLEEAGATENKNMYVNPLEITALAPSVKIPNYIYKNNGDLTFTNVRDEWEFQ